MEKIKKISEEPIDKKTRKKNRENFFKNINKNNKSPETYSKKKKERRHK